MDIPFTYFVDKTKAGFGLDKSHRRLLADTLRKFADSIEVGESRIRSLDLQQTVSFDDWMLSGLTIKWVWAPGIHQESSAE
jgi:hypothetical protein